MKMQILWQNIQVMIFYKSSVYSVYSVSLLVYEELCDDNALPLLKRQRRQEQRQEHLPLEARTTIVYSEHIETPYLLM